MPRGTGSAIYSNSALAGTAILVKTGKCSLTWYHILNTTTAEAYVMLYDVAAAASVTLGTTTPTIILGVHAETAAGLGAATCAGLPRPLQFTNGIVAASLTATTGSTGAIAAVSLGIGD